MLGPVHIASESIVYLDNPMIADRGTQMKAKPLKAMLDDLGISQKFSRPRTPNDNPFIESLFATTKCAPQYPGAFQDDIVALAYFVHYFYFYNNVRLHGKIGYVTPAQRHCGEDKAILALRRKRCLMARKKRLEQNRGEVLNLFNIKEKERKVNCLVEAQV